MVTNTDPGMTPSAMKKLLDQSVEAPVNFAFAMGQRPNTAVLLLDRLKHGKSLENVAAAALPHGCKSCFGTVTVTVDQTARPKLVVFRPERKLPGMAKELVHALKGTGYTAVRIEGPDGSRETDAEDAEGVSPVSPPPARPLPARPLPTPPSPVRDLRSLRHTLAALIGNIASVQDRAARAPLVVLAEQANGALQAEDAVRAERLLVQLQRGITDLSGAPNDGRLKTTLANFEGTLEQVRESIAKLEDALRETQEPAFVRVAEHGLGWTLGELRDAVVTALRETISAGPSQLKSSAGAARALCGKWAKLVAGDKVYGLLDTNPFGVPLACRAQVGAALAGVEREVAALA